MNKSFFWGGVILTLMGGFMYCFERFSAYISQAIILAGYTNHGTTIEGMVKINIHLNTNGLVPLFLVVGVVFILASIVLGIVNKEIRQK